MSEPDHSCRLYLAVPHGADDAERDLARALDAGDVACVLLRAGPGGCVDRGLAETLIARAHERDAAFLLEGDVDAAKALDADGVHVAAQEALYGETRAALGADAIVGAECGPSRDAALTLAENGADYIAFTPRAAGLIEWWADVTVVPCVALGVETARDAAAMAGEGADFIAPAESLWDGDGGMAEAVRGFAAAIAKRTAAA